VAGAFWYWRDLARRAPLHSKRPWLRAETSDGIVPALILARGCFMKRKIAAIFAADIAGYSRLVAEDEEETLRRLASYRLVTDDFIARGGGRIFNTAGDAVLAEFPSAVEAVRCAIDIQESLRTRNMAYPPSRQMAFRIGITIGDVVERDGDLLGDGVNIAARLEGLAEVGGICISRAVHEQVANKLSVQFADIGAQEVKNIPTPVHAYLVAMRREDGTYATPQVKKPAKAQGSAQPNWMWPVAVTVVSLAAIGVGGFLYSTKLETSASRVAAPSSVASPTPAPSAVASASPTPAPAVSAPPVAAPAAMAAAAAPPPMVVSTEKFAASSIPFIGDKARATLAADYAPAGDFKAFSLNVGGFSAFVTGQPSEEAAKTAAVEQCQKRAETAQSPRKCELYAVGDTVVYAHGKPPLPPLPWIRHDPATEQPFVARSVPLTREAGKTRLENVYATARINKAIAIGPNNTYFFSIAIEAIEEAVRRTLESCGGIAGVPCMIVALNDNFVVPIPTSLKVTGFFKASGNTMISADARDALAHRLAEAQSGWNAVAVGAAGRPGLGLKAATEQAAVDGALADCVKRDSNCRIIAIGPFSVGPN
jgi:class 3 adenylate cyclase